MANTRNDDLHYAAEHGSVVSCLALISDGADVNKRSDAGLGNSPLYIATLAGKTGVMELLLEEKAEINLSNSQGNKAIHAAVLGNQEGALLSLYEQGADLDAQNDMKQTALFIAVKNNNLNLAILLLKMGANVNIPDSHGVTPLHIAAKNNHIEMINVLLQFHADCNALTKRSRKKPIELTEDETAIALLTHPLAATSEQVNASNNMNRLLTAMSEIRNENLLKVNKLYQVNMHNAISPAVVFKKSGISELEAPKAIYIEAIHEIFQEHEQISEDEREHLLFNINNIAEREDIECYFDLHKSEEKKFLTDIVSILGKNSALKKRLRKQIKDETVLDDFKTTCRQKEIDTLHVGGVYGRACVWDAARQLGKQIYAKQLGDKHPNIRYVDNENDFQFENVFIDTNIAEGFFEPDSITFQEYVLFPQAYDPHILMNLTTPGTVEQFEDANKESVGYTYDENYSEINNPRNHKKMFNIISAFLFDNPYQSHSNTTVRSQSLFSHSQAAAASAASAASSSNSIQKKQKK
ncbi:MAG: ankyrin repeat domain-containing protein [Gammaproteobacteria bacterium]|nr:ankyrin repeat domain-containing protein [Gammaproteobacteria bacterium]